MIITVVLAFAGLVGIDVYMKSGGQPWAMACYAALLLGVGGLSFHAVRSIEEAEVVKKIFEAAFAELAQGLTPDQLGPKPFLNPELVQKGTFDLKHYMDEAKRLLMSQHVVASNSGNGWTSPIWNVYGFMSAFAVSNEEATREYMITQG